VHPGSHAAPATERLQSARYGCRARRLVGHPGPGRGGAACAWCAGYGHHSTPNRVQL